MARTVKQIEVISADLKKVALKIELLAADKLLNSRQRSAVESLQRSLDGVRGWELGIARQTLGLDGNLADLARHIKGGKRRGKES